MLTEQTSQSVAEFGRNTTETLDRLNTTGEAEVLTVDGEPRAVLVTPQMWEEIQSSRDAAAIRRAIRESDDGTGRDANECFDELQSKLAAMLEEERDGAGK